MPGKRVAESASQAQTRGVLVPPDPAPTFFSRFGAASPPAAVRPAMELPAAIYCEGLVAPVWGTARDLSAEGICIATPSVFPTGSVARIVLHGPSDPVWVEARALWQRYEDGERAILTGFRPAVTTRSMRRRLDALAADALRRIASTLAGTPALGLGFEDALALAPSVHSRRVRAGRVVRSRAGESDHAASLFVVEEGLISLHLAASDAKRRALEPVEGGGLFGSIAPPDARVREIAVAERASRLLEIDRDGFTRLLANEPRLAVALVGAAFRAASLRYGEALLARPPLPGSGSESMPPSRPG